MKSWKTPKGTELPLLSLKGKPYLAVQHRIIWFREERPTWRIETEYVTLTDKSALAKATIKDDAGNTMSTSHKFENVQGFPDFIEKCETGAIGRALALIGYGTQFCADELDEGPRIVDAPLTVVNPAHIPSTQPEEGDGVVVTQAYRIDFGTWNKKTLDQIYRELGPKEIENRIAYLESEAKKKNIPLTGKFEIFVKEAEAFLGRMENAPLDAPRPFL